MKVFCGEWTLSPLFIHLKMKDLMFEIKVALIGYVSVGKTTVLNALFREKFGEVSMRRTTAAVNFFCLDEMGCASPTPILAQTMEDNAAFRNQGSDNH